MFIWTKNTVRSTLLNVECWILLEEIKQIQINWTNLLLNFFWYLDYETDFMNNILKWIHILGEKKQKKIVFCEYKQYLPTVQFNYYSFIDKLLNVFLFFLKNHTNQTNSVWQMSPYFIFNFHKRFQVLDKQNIK